MSYVLLMLKYSGIQTPKVSAEDMLNAFVRFGLKVTDKQKNLPINGFQKCTVVSRLSF